MQLASNISESFNKLEKAYESSDKQSFDFAKKAMLESQKKINILLSKK